MTGSVRHETRVSVVDGVKRIGYDTDVFRYKLTAREGTHG